MGGTGIPPTGLLTDQHSRVMGWDDKPIEGLYAAGNSAARMETGAVMQSGISNARGMTYGWLAANDSRWMLKVGVGGLVRTVKVLVHVEEWDEPERVSFSYKLEGDPVQGAGSYAACRKGPYETEVALRVRVEGSGPMAPMWEAVSRPLLPRLAKSFAEKLKAEIETAVGAHP
jgi:carbon monoxide dehydrogenase subunit G